ncbi:MAG: GNAT family N-acetyltransferase [Candidatus Devosia phytovorans]|uniref:GNAT family N-acetyltransferase n=1 Tax=Candidatus Devosia phytovorans TaxID=3121372 RepID=A0AAJ5VVK2_9HYPH|nr:GNAT family N-acetyltransferase [Devosia sp.]WEK05609.1 MAG: GNAT family N-acetyltransferase [Devosia sp.]
MGGYSLVVGTPSVEDFLRLRKVSGLSEKTREAAERGLPNTWFAVTMQHDGQTVGMGRIIGDGGTAFQITDMAVEPAHQGKGLGKQIMAALVAHIHAEAPETAYISLVADGDAQHLYAKYGFEPVTPRSIGMALWLRPATT